jgi:class 3 adenylate cyclase
MEDRGIATVLFTDISGSTELALAVGDAAWAELLEGYHKLVRKELERFGGEEMDNAGDGFFAVFADAADAIGCACAVRDVVRELGIEIRCGVHSGHCWIAGTKCAGADVHVGARIGAEAAPGEVLVSRAAADAAGPNVTLAPRGRVFLKGIPEAVEVLAATPVVANSSFVSWASAATDPVAEKDGRAVYGSCRRTAPS